jgi:hypothetical protein
MPRSWRQPAWVSPSGVDVAERMLGQQGSASGVLGFRPGAPDSFAP